MNEVLQNIYERRSVRSYTDEKMSDDTIKEIIKAGFHAPNGHNEQGLRFAVITDPARLRACSEMARKMSLDYFSKANEQNPSKALQDLTRILQNPEFDVFYGAPVLILVFASASCLTPMEDGALAAENMMLAAHSLGLGSCWIGFAGPLQHVPDLMKDLNVPQDHKLIAPLVFGHPKKADMRPSSRVEPPILGWLR